MNVKYIIKRWNKNWFNVSAVSVVSVCWAALLYVYNTLRYTHRVLVKIASSKKKRIIKISRFFQESLFYNSNFKIYYCHLCTFVIKAHDAGRRGVNIVDFTVFKCHDTSYVHTWTLSHVWIWILYANCCEWEKVSDRAIVKRKLERILCIALLMLSSLPSLTPQEFSHTNRHATTTVHSAFCSHMYSQHFLTLFNVPQVYIAVRAASNNKLIVSDHRWHATHIAVDLSYSVHYLTVVHVAHFHHATVDGYKSIADHRNGCKVVDDMANCDGNLRGWST